MAYQRFLCLLEKYLEEWHERVRKGQVSGLTGMERISLRAFAEWLDRHEGHDIQDQG